MIAAMPRATWTASEALPALRAAADALGLGRHEPRLLRLGTNATARVGDLVVRVAPVDRDRDALVAELALARHVAGRVPVPWPADVPQPLEAAGRLATIWRWIPHDPEVRPEGRAFGALLRAFHAAAADFPGRLPAWRQPAIVDGWLAGLREHPSISPDERALLGRRRDELLAAIGWPPGAGEGGFDDVLHGDAHPGNVIVGPDGPVLLDLDLVARGPRAWDLAPAALHARRYAGGSGDWWRAVRAGYGPPVDPREEALVDLRELASALWLLAAQPPRPRAERAAEVDVRLRALAGDPDAPRWSAG